jgi:hypothetical protein
VAFKDLCVSSADGPRKFVELFLQVKDLFLQIYDVTSAQPRDFDPVFCDIETTTHNTLTHPVPPFFDHHFYGSRHLLH